MKLSMCCLALVMICGCEVKQEGTTTTINTSSTDSSSTSTSTTGGTKDDKATQKVDLEPCYTAPFIGDWHSYYEKPTGFIFKRDCTMSIPDCGQVAVLTDIPKDEYGNIKAIGTFKFEITKASRNTGCFDLGVHECDYAISGNIIKEFNFICDDETETAHYPSNF